LIYKNTSRDHSSQGKIPNRSEENRNFGWRAGRADSEGVLHACVPAPQMIKIAPSNVIPAEAGMTKKGYTMAKHERLQLFLFFNRLIEYYRNTLEGISIVRISAEEIREDSHGLPD
jgi:hypothetical protein